MIISKDPNQTEQKTILDDSAAIYQKREKKSERQKFSEMKTFSDKIKYIRMYYLAKVLGIAAVLALVISVIYTMVKPKPECVLRIAFVNSQFSDEITDEMEQDFINSDYFTLGEMEELIFDGTTYRMNSIDYTAQMALSTHIMAGDIDMMIAPESYFLDYAFNSTFGNLEQILPQDLKDKVEGQTFFCKLRQDDEEYENATGDEYFVGVYIENTAFWDKYKIHDYNKEPLVAGIVISSKHKDNAIAYLNYLFHN